MKTQTLDQLVTEYWSIHTLVHPEILGIDGPLVQEVIDSLPSNIDPELKSALQRYV